MVLENTLESPLGNEEINLSILKDINLNIHWKTDAEATILWPPDMKSHIVKAMVFQGVMYGCESWTIRKVEC